MDLGIKIYVGKMIEMDDNELLYTKKDLEKAYKNGHRNGSKSGMKLAGTEYTVLETITFDKWFKKNFG